MGMICDFSMVNKLTIDKLRTIKSYEEKLAILKEDIIESVDIGKSWQFLTYLLTGDQHGGNHLVTKLFYPINSSIEITDDEYDYVYKGEDEVKVGAINEKIDCNVSYLTPEEISEISDYLQSVSIENIFEDCDFNKVNQLRIYPSKWENSSEDKTYITKHFKYLNAFLKKSMEANNYIIVEIG